MACVTILSLRIRTFAILLLAVAPLAYSWKIDKEIINTGVWQFPQLVNPGLLSDDLGATITYSWENAGVEKTMSLEGKLLTPLRVDGTINKSYTFSPRTAYYCHSNGVTTIISQSNWYRFYYEWGPIIPGYTPDSTYSGFGLYPIGKTAKNGQVLLEYRTTGGSSDDTLQINTSFSGYIWVLDDGPSGKYTLPGGTVVNAFASNSAPRTGLIQTLDSGVNSFLPSCTSNMSFSNISFPSIPEVPPELTVCEFNMTDIDFGTVSAASTNTEIKDSSLQTICNSTANVTATIKASNPYGNSNTSMLGDGVVSVIFNSTGSPTAQYSVQGGGSMMDVRASYVPGSTPGTWSAGYIMELTYD
ncbi:hypothetical protein [Providencia manganoxydans]|uniref:hypothetical protein n=1 Tax=Providencia manganoxydans TaxID=2923283 RepID=UPI0034E3D6F2